MSKYDIVTIITDVYVIMSDLLSECGSWRTCPVAKFYAHDEIYMPAVARFHTWDSVSWLEKRTLTCVITEDIITYTNKSYATTRC